MTDTVHPPLAIIGGGNMAQAIVQGLVRAGNADRIGVVVAEPDSSKHPALAPLPIIVPDAASALVWLKEQEDASGIGQVLLAVKPQMLDTVAAALRPFLDKRPRVIISILAGVPTTRIRDALGPGAAVVRAMPNLPARIGQGTTAVCLGVGARPGDESFALDLFRDVGQLVVQLDESLMDAFTAVAGSGPAYLFYLAEAMTRAAVDLGFDPDTARDIVKETLAGSAELLARSFERAPDLRAAVTSKGGTTEAAVNALDAAGVMDAITRAITAARDRARQLAGG